MARDCLLHGSMVGWFMPQDTSLPHGILDKKFSIIQARLACYNMGAKSPSMLWVVVLFLWDDQLKIGLP